MIEVNKTAQVEVWDNPARYAYGEGEEHTLGVRIPLVINGKKSALKVRVVDPEHALQDGAEVVTLTVKEYKRLKAVAQQGGSECK